MKRVYVAAGFIGGLLPTVYTYFQNSEGIEPDAIIDLALLGWSFGISFILAPMGIVLGLSVVGLAHLVWNKFIRQ